MRDIMCSGYVAGGNTRFFGSDKSGVVQPGLTCNAVRDAMDKRLSFQDDANGEYDSMIAFCAPYGDGAKHDQVISISERLLPWEVNHSDMQKSYFPGGKENFKLANDKLFLGTIHFGEDVRAAENMEFISQARSAARAPPAPFGDPGLWRPRPFADPRPSPARRAP